MNKMVVLLFCLSFMGVILGSDDPVIPILQGTKIEPFFYLLDEGRSIVFNLSCGFLASLLLWFLIVHVPNLQKRKIIKRKLNEKYRLFKINMVRNLLYASDNRNPKSGLVEDLCNHDQFRRYFGGNKKQHWYDVVRGLDNNERHIDDIRNDLLILYNEITYVLNNVDFTEEKSYTSFVVLQENIFRLLNKNKYESEYVKTLSQFIYSIMGSWDFTEGAMADDVVQKMIDQV